MYTCNYSVIVQSFIDASLWQWLMLLGVSVHAAFEQFLYFFQKKKKQQATKILFFVIGIRKVWSHKKKR